MADEFDKDGIVETDGGVEFGPGGVVERDAEAGGLSIPRPLSRPFSGPLGGI